MAVPAATGHEYTALCVVKIGSQLSHISEPKPDVAQLGLLHPTKALIVGQSSIWMPDTASYLSCLADVSCVPAHKLVLLGLCPPVEVPLC